MAEPIAVLTGADGGFVDQLLTFDISQSYAPDGTISRWKINWGDGSRTQGKVSRRQALPDSVSHRYAAAGEYEITLVVSNNRNASSAPARLTVTITDDEPPAPDPDTTPDAFSFPPQTGVALNTAITSVSVTISGLTSAAPISVVDGSYSINGGGFVTTAGTITDGQSVRVRQTSANSYSSETVATLTIGGVSAGFSVTTEAQVLDITPAPFSFQAQNNVALNTDFVSNLVVISGMNATAPITITGGTYSIDSGSYTSSAGTIASGQTLRLKVTSSGSNATATSAAVTVGTYTTSFTVTTVAAQVSDSTPDQFFFQSQTGQPISTVVTSNTITVSGINTTVDISIAGSGTPQYSINGGAFTGSPGAGAISNGNTVRVRLTSSGSEGVTLACTLTIGGVVGSFSVTTAVITSTGPTYFIATTGNDTTGNGSIGTPWRTFAKGVQALGPGATLYARTGTYAENLLFNIPPGQSWTNKVLLSNYNGESVTIQPSSPSTGARVIEFAGQQRYIEIYGMTLDALNTGYDCVKVNGIAAGNAAHHIRLNTCTLLGTTSSLVGANTGSHLFLCSQLVAGLEGGNELLNCTLGRNPGIGDGFSHGCYLQSSNNIIIGNTFDGSVSWGGNGVQIFNGNLYGSGGDSSNNTILSNIFKSMTPAIRNRAITMGFGSRSCKLFNNLIYNLQGVAVPPNGNPYGGIAFEGSNHEVYNNTIYNCIGWGIHVYSTATGSIIRNNIAYSNTTNFAFDYPVTFSNNLFGTNPLFVSAGSNFALTAASPARNAGLTIPAITEDITGLARPQGAAYDIGAYEFDE